MSLSGIRDVDLKILMELEDRDLFNYCIANKAINNLCKNENFWRNRFIKKYGLKAAQYKDGDKTWKQYYLKVTADIDMSSPWEFFNTIEWTIDDKNIKNIPNNREESETFINRFWLLNLGNNVTLSFPIDLYEELPNIVRTYTTDQYFTPYDILKLIYDFYQEKITLEELEMQIDEAENPYAEDYDEFDLGDVRRADLLGQGFFIGITPGNGIYKISIEH